MNTIVIIVECIALLTLCICLLVATYLLYKVVINKNE